MSEEEEEVESEEDQEEEEEQGDEDEDDEDQDKDEDEDEDEDGDEDEDEEKEEDDQDKEDEEQEDEQKEESNREAPSFGARVQDISPLQLVGSILSDLEDMSGDVDGLITTFPSQTGRTPARPRRPDPPRYLQEEPPQRQIQQGRSKVEYKKDQELQVDFDEKVIIPKRGTLQLSEQSQRHLIALEERAGRHDRWNPRDAERRFVRRGGEEDRIDQAVRILLRR